MPDISVLLTVLNGESYLNNSIESILAQTYPSFELIVINDGSTDKTSEIIRKYTSKDPRVKLIEFSINQGTSRALNAGLAISCGKYITRQDADDISLPDRFEKQINYLENNPEVGAVGTAAYIIDPSGTRNNIDFTLSDPNEIRNILPDKMCLCGPTVLIKRNWFERIGLFFSDDLSYSEDYDLCLRIREVTQISNIGTPLYEYRIHTQSVSQSRRYIQIRNKAIALERSTIRQFGDHPPLTQTELIARDYFRAYVLASTGQKFDEANQCLSKAILFDPEILDREDKISMIINRYLPRTSLEERINFIELLFSELISMNKKLINLKNKHLAEIYISQIHSTHHSVRNDAYLWKAVRLSPKLLLNRGVIARIFKSFR